MKKTVLAFGLISGAISAAMMLVAIPFVDKVGWEKGEILGYTTIVLPALMVFFGVRSYRENVGGRAFDIRPRVRRRHPDYLDFQRVLRGNLANRLLQIHARFCREICCLTWWRRRRPPGRASRSWLRPSRKQSSSSRCTTIQRSMWAPTFMEVFPIGLAVTLLSAGILRKQAGQMPA